MFLCKKKVKFTLVQALRLCTGRMAHRGSGGIALLFHDNGTRRGWGVSVTPRPLFTPPEGPGTHCTDGWVGPRAGLDRCGKSRLPGIRSPDRPARSQSLYQLSYPAHNFCMYIQYIFVCTYSIFLYVHTVYFCMYIQYIFICTYSIFLYVHTVYFCMYIQYIFVCTYSIFLYVHTVYFCMYIQYIRINEWETDKYCVFDGKLRYKWEIRYGNNDHVILLYVLVSHGAV